MENLSNVNTFCHFGNSQIMLRRYVVRGSETRWVQLEFLSGRSDGDPHYRSTLTPGWMSNCRQLAVAITDLTQFNSGWPDHNSYIVWKLLHAIVPQLQVELGITGGRAADFLCPLCRSHCQFPNLALGCSAVLTTSWWQELETLCSSLHYSL